jgi:putative ABC transport system permease protein
VLDHYPQLIGVPLPLTSYQPKIVAGRWLRPDDTYAVVLHEQLAKRVGVQVGDWVVISIPDSAATVRWRSERRWQVVGLLFDPANLSMAMTPRRTLAREIGGAGSGNQLQIGTASSQPEQIAALAQHLRGFYDGQGIAIAPSTTDTLAQRSAKFITDITTVSTLLIVMAAIVAAVGGIALSGVLAISVLERRREIGVLRAIGATPRTILTQFIAEGLILGWLSWLIAFGLSYPAGAALTALLSNKLQRAIVYQYSFIGVLLWLALATLIGVAASWSPARGAIQMSVQESLAYE